MDGSAVLALVPVGPSQKSVQSSPQPLPHAKSNQVGTVLLCGIHIVSLFIEGQERLCLAQISNTLLKQFSYNEIHNRRVALGITCVQCTPAQLESLRRAGAMPPSSRRCGMITRREAERLCKSFLSDNAPPRLPEDFAFAVYHECSWGCKGHFLPSRYNSSRAKCTKCSICQLFFSPNKFIFHSHQTSLSDKLVPPDAANFNSWRRHMKLLGDPPAEIVHAWEDVKAMFNGGTRKRMTSKPINGGNQTDGVLLSSEDGKAIFNDGSRKRLLAICGNPRESAAPAKRSRSSPTAQISSHPLPVQQQPPQSRIPQFSELPLSLPHNLVMDYVWHQRAAAVAAAKTPGFAFPPYGFPWIAKQGPVLFPGPLPPPLSGTATSEPLIPAAVAAPLHQSAFRPVIRSSRIVEIRDEETSHMSEASKEVDSEDEVDIETMEDEDPPVGGTFSSDILNSETQNTRSNVTTVTSGTSSVRSVASPQCWSPARETEREAEKMAEEAAALRDVKPEIYSTKSLESWRGSAFYPHLNVLKNCGESSDRSTPDCSKCRSRGLFQVHSPPASTN